MKEYRGYIVKDRESGAITSFVLEKYDDPDSLDMAISYINRNETIAVITIEEDDPILAAIAADEAADKLRRDTNI